MKWFKDNLAGPLSMFFISTIGAGMFTLVSIALDYKIQVKVMSQFMESSLKNDKDHDATDKSIAEAIKAIADEQSKNETRDTILRHDFDELRRGLRNADK